MAETISDPAGAPSYTIEPIDIELVQALRESDSYSDWRRIAYPTGCAIYSSELNALLRESRIPIADIGGGFSPPGELAAAANELIARRQQAGTLLFDAEKIRLESDLTVEAVHRNQALRLGRTRYFHATATNDLTGRVVRHGDVIVHDGVSLAATGGVLDDYAVSRLSNHLSVSTIAVTSDGRIVLPTQSSSLAVYGGMLVPSATGSVDVEDLEAGPATLRDLLDVAIGRELREEIGVDERDHVTKELIGFARLLERGGKPEFFYLCFLAVPHHILNRTSEHEALRTDMPVVSLDEHGVMRLRSSLDSVRDGVHGVVSPSLRLNLIMLDELLASAPSLFLNGLRRSRAEELARRGERGSSVVF